MVRLPNDSGSDFSGWRPSHRSGRNETEKAAKKKTQKQAAEAEAKTKEQSKKAQEEDEEAPFLSSLAGEQIIHEAKREQSHQGAAAKPAAERNEKRFWRRKQRW